VRAAVAQSAVRAPGAFVVGAQNPPADSRPSNGTPWLPFEITDEAQRAVICPPADGGSAARVAQFYETAPVPTQQWNQRAAAIGGAARFDPYDLKPQLFPMSAPHRLDDLGWLLFEQLCTQLFELIGVRTTAWSRSAATCASHTTRTPDLVGSSPGR